MRELNNEEQEELNHQVAPTKVAKEIKQKPKSEGQRILNQPGKKNLFMASTEYETITLMLTKRKPISGFEAQG